MCSCMYAERIEKKPHMSARVVHTRTLTNTLVTPALPLPNLFETHPPPPGLHRHQQGHVQRHEAAQEGERAVGFVSAAFIWC